ncbi:MAG: DUF6807 family protein, partial [Pricia sp.]
MTLKSIFLGFTSVLLCCVSCSEEKAAFLFEIDGNTTAKQGHPVSIDLKQIADAGIDIKRPLQLNTKNNGEEVRLDYQIDSINDSFWFVQANSEETDDILSYRITNLTEPRKMGLGAYGREKNGDLQLTLNRKPVVTYRYGMTYPPEGVDSIYKKSGYIHPILTPRGDTLSRIQPPDHYH